MTEKEYKEAVKLRDKLSKDIDGYLQDQEDTIQSDSKYKRIKELRKQIRKFEKATVKTNITLPVEITWVEVSDYTGGGPCFIVRFLKTDEDDQIEVYDGEHHYEFIANNKDVKAKMKDLLKVNEEVNSLAEELAKKYGLDSDTILSGVGI